MCLATANVSFAHSLQIAVPLTSQPVMRIKLTSDAGGDTKNDWPSESEISVCDIYPRLSHGCYRRVERQVLLLETTVRIAHLCGPSPAFVSQRMCRLHKLRSCGMHDDI